MKRRLLSLLLALALCLGLAPTGWTAENTPDTPSDDYVAKVKIGGNETEEETYCTSFEEAWEKALEISRDPENENFAAEIHLLKDAEVNGPLTVGASESIMLYGMDTSSFERYTVTFNGGGIRVDDAGGTDGGALILYDCVIEGNETCLTVNSGNAFVSGSDIISKSKDSAAVCVNGGELTINGAGAIKPYIKGECGALDIKSGSVSLDGGTFEGAQYIISMTSGKLTDLLKSAHYFTRNGTPIPIKDLSGQSLDGDPVKVELCSHDQAKYTHIEESKKHNGECDVCGLEWEEDCRYTYTHTEDGHTAKCEQCEDEVTEEHSFSRQFVPEADTTTVAALVEKCICGFKKGEKVATLTINIPEKVTYGDTDKELSYTIEPSSSFTFTNVEWAIGDKEPVSGATCSLAGLPAGEHYRVYFWANDDSDCYFSTVFSISISPKPITVEVKVMDKFYDGKTDAEIEDIKVNGVVEGDNITVMGLTAEFESETVWDNKKVLIKTTDETKIVNVSEDGPTSEPNNNYELISPAPVGASIKKATPTVTVTPNPPILNAGGNVEVEVKSVNPNNTNLQDMPPLVVTYKIDDTDSVDVTLADDKFTIPTAGMEPCTITINAKSEENDNYTVGEGSAIVTITNQKIVDILVPDATDKTKTYDGYPATFSGKPTVTIGGQPVVDEDNKPVEVPFTVEWLTEDGVAPVNAGSYRLKLKVNTDEYLGESNPVDFTIEKATPYIQITAPNEQKPGTEVEVTASARHPGNTGLNNVPQPMTLIYRIGSGEQINIEGGKFTIPEDTPDGTIITITASTLETENYEAATKTAEILVTDTGKTAISITGVEVKSKVYNGTAVEPSGTPEVMQGGEEMRDVEVKYVWKDSTGKVLEAAPIKAGAYTLTLTVDTGLYAGESTPISFTISKAPVTITAVADKTEIVVGDDMPAFSCTVNGLVEGENLSRKPDVTCEAKDTSKAGTYKITASGAEDASGNYEIKYVEGKLIIKDAAATQKTEITITAENKEAVVGDEKLPEFTWTVSGLKGEDKLSKDPTLTCEAKDTSKAGTFDITPSGAELPEAIRDQYEIKYQSGTLTIKDAPTPPAQTETKTEYKLGLTQVPAALAGNPYLNTTAKIEAALTQRITQLNSSIPAWCVALYDVTLYVSTDGGKTWEEATRENFPASGRLTVELPYPAGTDSRYSFTVVHMFTTSDFGRVPGDMEHPYVYNTAGGIRFEVTGLSPIAVGWTLPANAWTDPSNSSLKPIPSGGSVRPSVPSNTVTNPGGPEETPASRPASCNGVNCPSRAFYDLGGGWYHDAIDYALENGLMSGYENGTFGPYDHLSRAMVAQIFYNREHQPAVAGGGFRDVPGNAWYAQAVSWASIRGIVTGYGDGRFGPDDSITREQFIIMLWRYAWRPGSNVPLPDGVEPSDSQYALRWARENGILYSTNGTMDVYGLATRAEAAQMLMNYLEQ